MAAAHDRQQARRRAAELRRLAAEAAAPPGMLQQLALRVAVSGRRPAIASDRLVARPAAVSPAAV